MFKTTFAVVMLGTASALAQAAPDACDRLAQLKIANTTITTKMVAAGAFEYSRDTPPAQIERYKSAPQFCRVIAHSHPAADSDIVIEVWLPATGWNAKLQGLGNGGFAGTVPYASLAASIKRGYAAVGTDTGHVGGDKAAWALGHPEKVTDFGYRAIHEMTAVAKTVVRAFYGNPAQHSYFLGCSTGGRQGLMEAQRFPEDYDGILSGAPAHNWTHLLTSALWSMQVLGNDPEGFIPRTKWKAVEAAVNSACDANDGVKDGILNDPRQCHFNPASMECRAGTDDSSCLTAKQVVALKKMYTGPVDAHGKPLFFGLLPGAESRPSGWETWVSGAKLGDSNGFFFGKEYFVNFVYQDPNWDYHRANIEESMKAADERNGKVLDETDPNLSPFAKRGGKLILYHGWNDPAIPSLNTIDYFKSVERKMGATTQHFLRLYMVPGMQHCGGGPGATSIGGNQAPFEPARNIYSALEQWVEKGVAPGTIIASRSQPQMTRPLCPYPQSSKYNGEGDPNDAANFSCVKP